VSLSTDGLLDELAILRAENADLRRQLEEANTRYADALNRPPVRASGTDRAIEWLRDETVHTAEGWENAELVARELDRLYAVLKEASGKAQRTVYVWATMESEAIDIATRAIEATDASIANELRKTWTGYTKHAVTLTARKAKL